MRRFIVKFIVFILMQLTIDSVGAKYGNALSVTNGTSVQLLITQALDNARVFNCCFMMSLVRRYSTFTTSGRQKHSNSAFNKILRRDFSSIELPAGQYSYVVSKLGRGVGKGKILLFDFYKQLS